jgi:hypothetical protein
MKIDQKYFASFLNIYYNSMKHTLETQGSLHPIRDSFSENITTMMKIVYPAKKVCFVSKVFGKYAH